MEHRVAQLEQEVRSWRRRLAATWIAFAVAVVACGGITSNVETLNASREVRVGEAQSVLVTPGRITLTDASGRQLVLDPARLRFTAGGRTVAELPATP